MIPTTEENCDLKAILWGLLKLRVFYCISKFLALKLFAFSHCKLLNIYPPNIQFLFLFIKNQKITNAKTSVFFCQSLDIAARTKVLQEKNAELEKEMVELKRQLEVTTV